VRDGANLEWPKRAAAMLPGVLVLIVFAVGVLPLIWVTIAYWLGLEVPPIREH
jgi:hypothetical protein